MLVDSMPPEAHARVVRVAAGGGVFFQKHLFPDVDALFPVALCGHTTLAQMLEDDDPGVHLCPACQSIWIADQERATSSEDRDTLGPSQAAADPESPTRGRLAPPISDERKLLTMNQTPHRAGPGATADGQPYAVGDITYQRYYCNAHPNCAVSIPVQIGTN